MSDVLYLYGFVPSDAPPPPELAGIGGSPVERLPLDGVAAIISRVPRSRLDPATLDARLQDLDWVGEQGLAHEAVVLWYVDHADILPARLFTLHSSEAALRAAFAGRAGVVDRQLRALAGRREWNLKIAYDAAELGRHGADVSAELRALDADIDGAPPGRRYLLERKRDDVLKREVARGARRLAGELLDALRPHAEAVRVLALAGGDEAGTVVLNAALLVERGAEAALRQEAERQIAAQAALGMLPALSGPWAPYRFLEADADS
jgi:hypothetical protein